MLRNFAAVVRGRGVRHRASRRWAPPLNWLCIPPVLAVTCSSIQAQPGSSDLVTSYGYTAFGTLKYPAGFTHVDYANPNAPKGGTYRYANAGSFDSLNFMNVLGATPPSVIIIYDTLMRRAGDEPASRYALVAQSITYPKDLAWMDFHLNPRAHWHDGKPITPEDVMWTIEQSKGLVSPSLKRVQTAVARTERRGPRTVRVYFAQKNNPTLPTVVMDMYLLPRHYFRNHDILKPSLDKPLGSAAYKIGRVSPGRWIEFERVKDYWAKDLPINKGRYNFDRIRHDYYRDATVANEAFLSGNSDLKFENSAVRWASEAQLPAFRSGHIRREAVPYKSASNYVGMYMNTRRQFLADRRVREALLLAYDFEWVRRVVLKGHHGRLHSFFANGDFEAKGLPSPGERRLLETVRNQVPPEIFTQVPTFPVGGSWERRRANIIKAAEILRNAGHKLVDGKLIDKRTGKPVVLQLVSYSPLMDKQVSLFVASARQLGIQVVFRSYDAAQFRLKLRDYDYDLLVNVPSFAGLETPSFGMTLIWGSKAADMPQQLNYAGVKNAAADKMLDTMLKAQDRATVVSAMRALDRILIWNHYAIPFQHNYPAAIGQMPLTFWDRFGKPAKQPTYNFSFYSLDNWWLDRAKDARLQRGQ